ncbi:MAG: hypothetical protein QXK48_00245 [Candidatus Aenigmatarchaeota archaeon]
MRTISSLKVFTPQIDEIFRPMLVSLLYRAVERIVYKIDEIAIKLKDTSFGNSLFSNSSIFNKLFLTYPSNFHRYSPKMLTLLSLALWEGFETLFSKRMRSSGFVFPTTLGTLEDILMDTTTLFTQPSQTFVPKNREFEKTIKKLEEMGYKLTELKETPIKNNRSYSVSIYSSPKIVDIEELKNIGEKPSSLTVYDNMYGKVAIFNLEQT